MITIVLRDGTTKSVEARLGATVLDICRDADISEIEAVCGGNCSCATCHVYLKSADGTVFSERTEDEEDLLSFSSHLTDESRLACQLILQNRGAEFTVVIAPED